MLLRSQGSETWEIGFEQRAVAGLHGVPGSLSSALCP